VEFADEGNIVGIGFAKGPLRSPPIESAASWRGSGKVFGDKLQWLVQDGRPGAAIIRVWRVDVAKDGEEREVQELKVFRLDRTKACEYAVIDARQPTANEQATKYALEAMSRACSDR
jgi:hypothetical protein